jgi:hypothetical protein
MTTLRRVFSPLAALLFTCGVLASLPAVVGSYFLHDLYLQLAIVLSHCLPLSYLTHYPNTAPELCCAHGREQCCKLHWQRSVRTVLQLVGSVDAVFSDRVCFQETVHFVSVNSDEYSISSILCQIAGFAVCSWLLPCLVCPPHPPLGVQILLLGRTNFKFAR